MGRMKVYGGSWDLPGVATLDIPFRDYIISTDDDREPNLTGCANVMDVPAAISGPPTLQATAPVPVTAVVEALEHDTPSKAQS